MPLDQIEPQYLAFDDLSNAVGQKVSIAPIETRGGVFVTSTGPRITGVLEKSGSGFGVYMLGKGTFFVDKNTVETRQVMLEP